MSIKFRTLQQAISEAERFILLAKIVQRESGNTEFAKRHKVYEGGMHCAAAKRASMDLSRALVAVRRGDRA